MLFEPIKRRASLARIITWVQSAICNLLKMFKRWSHTFMDSAARFGNGQSSCQALWVFRSLSIPRIVAEMTIAALTTLLFRGASEESVEQCHRFLVGEL